MRGDPSPPPPHPVVHQDVAFPHLLHLIDAVGLTRRGFCTRLEERGFSYSETSLGNWQRRGIPHKHGLLTTIVRVLIESSSATCRCTAHEVLQFLAPAGFPFAELREIAPLFPPNEFRAALIDHMPLFVASPDDTPLPGRLPIQRTSFIGREQECHQVSQVLTEHHLLTLWGTGGCGKTRLALHVVADLQRSFRHGACFVDLSTVRDPDLVLPTIAHALHLSETAQQPLDDRLLAYLSHRHGILLLDNFEQVIEAAPLLLTLLDAAPLLHLVVTSREPLHLSGERQYEVPPLTLPDVRQLPAAWPQQREVLLQSEALHLFVERARAAKFDFALTRENAPAVAAVCAGLEGLPLLIELVAARITTFTPQAMHAQIDQRLTLAAATLRNLPLRQRSATAMIAWSYTLLPPDEQTLFVRLAVFAGSFTLAAAEAVCPVAGDLDGAVLPGLEALVNKSLLHPCAGVSSEPRFRMLETIRAYAQTSLQSRAEAPSVHERHAVYYQAQAEHSRAGLHGPQQGVWLCQLEHDHDNLRTALRWLLDQGDAETALHLCAALELFWYWCGHQREGRWWLERILEHATLSDAARAKGLDEAGGFAWALGDYAQARTLADQSLALWQQLDSPTGMVEALNTLGLTAESLGDLEQAIAVHQRSLELRRTLGNSTRIAVTLGNLGDAELYHQPAQPEQAIARFKEALHIFQSLDDTGGMAGMLVSLGDAALCQGATDRAAAQLRQSLVLYQQRASTNHTRIARCLERLAAALTAQGQAERSARLLGAAATLRTRSDLPRPPIYQSTYAQTVNVTRASLGIAAYARAYEAGAALTLEQAIQEALALPAPPTSVVAWDAAVLATWHPEPPGAQDDPATRAVLVTPPVEPPVPCAVVIPSWHAVTPPGTWIAVQIQARIGTHWTRAYHVVTWDSAPDQSRRRSFTDQHDDAGRVDTETLRLTTPATAVQVRVLLCAERTDCWPELHRLVLCLSARTSGTGLRERRNLTSTPFQAAPPLTVPHFSQYHAAQGHDWCSPTVLAMVLGYWHARTGDARLAPFCSADAIATHVLPLVYDPSYGPGNWAFNTAYAASLGLEASVTRLDSLHQVARWVAAGVPIICSLAWEDGALEGAPLPQSQGHLLVVTGVRADGYVVVADPAGADATAVARTYRMEQFMACWQGHSAGTVYLVYPPGWSVPAPQPGDAWV